MPITQTTAEIAYHQDGVSITFPRLGDQLLPPTITSGGELIAQSLYFLLWTYGDEEGRVTSADQYRLKEGDTGACLEIDIAIPEKLSVTLRFHFSGDHFTTLAITAEPDANSATPFAFRCLGLVPGQPTREVRLCAGLYSGWTIGGQTLLLLPVEAAGKPRMAITIDPDDVSLGRGEYDPQAPVACAPLSPGYPVALTKVQTRHWDDLVIEGAFTILLDEQPIGHPSHHETARAYYPETAGIPPARYSLRRYLDDFLGFLDHPEMFISLGDGDGLFHRGFYNCTERGSFAVAEGKESPGKQFAGALMFRHPSIADREKHPERYPNMQVFGEYGNMAEPLCDMVWGGAHNVQTALFLYRCGALTAKAEQIIRAVLHYRNADGQGFQIAEGPCQGAWWNAYQPRRQAFSSRYYEPTVGMPDQGLFNYYLAELYQSGYVQDEAIPSAIAANCRDFLEPRLEADGSIYHVYTLDGKVGYTREKRSYPDASPCGMLLVSLGFLAGYRLTGESRWKALALKTARQVVDRFISHYRWGYLEYDTMGADTMGISRMLLALSELYREEPSDWLREAAETTLRHLVAHQHHRDLDFVRYMNNEAAWGGAPCNEGGFIHGYTYNSPQGLGALTFRSDLSEGLLAAWEALDSPLAHTSLLKYMHCLTWHQVVRRDIAFGYGSTSEHLNLKANYLQDTFQVSNAMPFGIERLLP